MTSLHCSHDCPNAAAAQQWERLSGETRAILTELVSAHGAAKPAGHLGVALDAARVYLSPPAPSSSQLAVGDRVLVCHAYLADGTLDGFDEPITGTVAMRRLRNGYLVQLDKDVDARFQRFGTSLSTMIATESYCCFREPKAGAR